MRRDAGVVGQPYSIVLGGSTYWYDNATTKGILADYTWVRSRQNDSADIGAEYCFDVVFEPPSRFVANDSPCGTNFYPLCQLTSKALTLVPRYSKCQDIF